MRAMFFAASVVLGLAVLIGASRLWAEDKKQKPNKPETPRTRIGLVNLTYVLKKYKEFSIFKEEMKNLAGPYQKKNEKLKARAEKLKKEKEESKIVPAGLEDIDATLKQLQRQIEENSSEAKKALAKKSEASMKDIYMEVTRTAQEYARTHDLDLVLFYNDAITEKDYMSNANILRKLQTGALLPVYAAPDMDISATIVNILNQTDRKDTGKP